MTTNLYGNERTAKMNGMEERRIYLLLKFAKEKEHLEAFRYGRLFMHPLAYFTELEETCSGRGDAFEGVSTIIQPRDVGILRIDTSVASIGTIIANSLQDLAGPIKIRQAKTHSCNIFCMVAITEATGDALAPNAIKQLGEWFVIVMDVSAFIRRVIDGAKHNSDDVSELEYGLVEYHNTDLYTGEMGRFRKRLCYQYQSEFRIALEPASQGPRSLMVGDIHDITSEVLPWSAALQGWTFTRRAN